METNQELSFSYKYRSGNLLVEDLPNILEQIVKFQLGKEVPFQKKT